jgi:glycosyltransferase involved in cell wall biosynthesis
MAAAFTITAGLGLSSVPVTRGENPKVSIGLPVFNGAGYLDEAIRSILSQDFADLELILSDNASTDATPQIIERWMQKDDRIVSHRHRENLGAATNFNTVLQMARGEYFRWAGHDDLLAPTMVAKCVEVLDSTDTSVVAVAPTTVMIDESGKEVGVDHPLELPQVKITARFRRAVRRVGRANVLFGLMRTDAARSLRGLASFPSADQVLIAELSLRGRILRINEPLFYRRVHPRSSWRAVGKYEGFAEWFDPKQSHQLVFPAWRIWLEMVRTPLQAPIPWAQRLSCAVLAAVIWPRRKHRRMIAELRRVPQALRSSR